jgi:hypothetical protein
MAVSGFGVRVDAKLKVDKLKDLAQSLKDLAQLEVYVGIPEARTGRKGDGVNNAQLLFIHTNGSELRNIPARPVIEPAIEADDNKKLITYELGAAAKALFEKNAVEVRRRLHRAGALGRDAAKKWFTDPRNGWEPNKFETVRRKLMQLTGKRRTTALSALMSGAADYAWEGGNLSLDTPLIDTAQMRNSITYIVVTKGSVEEDQGD